MTEEELLLQVRDLEILIGILIIVRIFIQRVKNTVSWKNTANEYLDSFITSGLIAILLVSYIISPFYVPSSSMEPTFVPVDYIIVNKFIYRFNEPKRGDIIVFSPPHRKKSPDYVKRLVGMPGETLEVKEGKVLINGKELQEPYLIEEHRPEYDYGPVKIPDGNFFMMGDNRNNSEDSHVWGFLPRKNIVGKAWFIFWPIWRGKIL